MKHANAEVSLSENPDRAEPVFCLKAWLNWFQREVWLHGSLWESDPAPHLSYHLTEQFPDEFMISIASLKSSSIQHDVQFANYDAI